MTRVQASATGHHQTHKTVARAAPSCDADVAPALPDGQKHATTKTMTMPVPSAGISIIGDTTTSFDWPFQPDQRLSAIKGIDPHAGDGELVQLGALEGTISTKYAASTTSPISSSDKPASSGAGSQVRASQAPRPHPPPRAPAPFPIPFCCP